jgi:phenylglyoxylate dehydrogenase epsilon subunit
LKKRRQIIIGSGTAALSALKQLRKAGCDDEVAVVAMEAHAPYSPMSLPYVVSGKVSQTDISMVPGGFFEGMGATFVKGRRVTAVDAREQRICYEDGGTDPYDRLLIATGSDPIVPPVLAAGGATGFHVMDDCAALMEQLKGGRRVVIVGAGLVAMEMAAALRSKAPEVTVVAPRERILRSYFDEEASTRIRALFAGSGVNVHLDWGEAVAVDRHGEQARVRFAQGNTVEAEVLLACIGVKPRIDLLAGSGIEIGGGAGVLVDGGMRTNIPTIFAAGDVAEAADFFTGRKTVSPILPSAVSQGRIAGSSMADLTAEYEGSLPMNTFNFFGHLAVSIGRGAAVDGDEVLIGNGTDSYKRLVFSGDRLVGAAFLDEDVDAGVFQYLIRKKIATGRYREMILESPREVAFWLMNEAEKGQTHSREE